MASLITLEQVTNQVAGTFTMHLTYSGSQSWIGIGINQQGTSNMTPTTAIIGCMLNAAPSMLKYKQSPVDQPGCLTLELFPWTPAFRVFKMLHLLRQVAHWCWNSIKN